MLLGKKIWILVGTRPDVIKQAPVYKACLNEFGKGQVALIATGQHRELLEQALATFELNLDLDLEIMQPGQSLCKVGATNLEKLGNTLEENQPKWVIVQGDTTSAAMAAWAAFQNKIQVAHNEAGLRSFDLENPFPEEANRKLISTFADIHFAPTAAAQQALISEGVEQNRIHVTGNTGIDSLAFALSRPTPTETSNLLDLLNDKKLKPILLTAHRRENKEAEMKEWFKALAQFIQAHPDYALIYPMHPNNAGKSAAERFLRPLDQVFLTPPMEYLETCHLLKRCEIVVTDSGGLQEEAGTLGIPTVVCRKTTERREGIEAGIAKLAGTNTQSILECMDWALRLEKQNAKLNTFYGDGKSGERISRILKSMIT